MKSHDVAKIALDQVSEMIESHMIERFEILIREYDVRLRISSGNRHLWEEVKASTFTTETGVRNRVIPLADEVFRWRDR